MIGKNDKSKRGQYTFISLDDLVPKDHLLRKVDGIVVFDFIYKLVEPLYNEDEGRPSLDPVILIKLPLIQYLFGIKSMRQTIKEIQVNNAYRWFHKGEHKQVFAYSIQTACDKSGWVLNYTVNPGNRHDSQTFNGLYKEIKSLNPEMIVADTGYKTPAIANMLLNDDITPIFPYKRPMTKKEFFKKHQYVYDEYYDCYLCPNDKVLKYSTTNRDGYREFKSDPKNFMNCPLIQYCTESQKHQKVITRHVWDSAIEYCEDIRLTPDGKRIYAERKESIERLFGTAKEFHFFRYTNMCGTEKMEMKTALTFACLNIKKLVNVLS